MCVYECECVFISVFVCVYEYVRVNVCVLEGLQTAVIFACCASSTRSG